MNTIALPKKIEYQAGEKANEGQMIIEPLFPGYGITLGNSIRRVLLSSLPGAAAIGIKIKGVDHEFMALPHLKEDILEFILNLKQLQLKVYSDEVVRLELKVHGEKEIKAGDITKNSEVEIANPDLVLGHITDMSGSLEAEIFVSQGMGYETIENREKTNKEIGYIEMDSIYSPILSAGVKIDNVRVGKMTNWDKLIIDIITDGTIKPEEAFKKSVNILINQFSSLIGEKKEEIKTEDTVEAEELDTEEEKEAIEEDEVEPKKKRGRPKKSE